MDDSIVKKWKIVYGVYLVTAVIFAVQRYFVGIQDGRPFEVSYLVLDHTGNAAIWAVLSIFVIRQTSKHSLDDGRWIRIVSFMVSLGLVLSLVHAVIYVYFQLLIEYGAGVRNGIDLRDVELSFSQLNPVWRFFNFSVIVIISYGYDFYRLAIVRERMASELQTQLVAAQLQALKMQLQPHFLFNTLHAIGVLIFENPKIAAAMLTDLSDLLRMTLEDSNSQTVTLKKEMEFLERYLEIEKKRFGNRLSVSFEIRPDVLDAQVPYMVLQPLVENAIKHGISRHSGPGFVIVTGAGDQGRLRLRVSDSSRGSKTGSSPLGEGIGLSNTRKRLEQLYHSDFDLVLENQEENGFAVTILLPLESAPRMAPLSAGV